MDNKEREYKMYKDYIESMYGEAYMSAIAKLSVPTEYQYDENGYLRKELYLTEKEKNAVMYAFPYLLHEENTDSIRTRK
jgi:hypothetical protein